MRLGWGIFTRQSPVRFVILVATSLMKEGFKVKLEAWKQNSPKLAVKKTFVWIKNKRRNKTQSENDVVALDAGKKYVDLATRRLVAARASFEAAAVELRAAERGMKDAQRYLATLHKHCKQTRNSKDRCDCFNDAVFVEHAAQIESDETSQLRDDTLAPILAPID
mmetsp:Transcript_15209/g.19543  ORF Transcript_15209/g.19543 Transcript_15209/m.19543 type:complete len:165 (+) Transcript_15209:3-497(+)